MVKIYTWMILVQKGRHNWMAVAFEQFVKVPSPPPVIDITSREFEVIRQQFFASN